MPEITPEVLKNGDQLSYWLFISAITGMVALIGLLTTVAWFFGKQAVKNFSDSIEKRFAVGDDRMDKHDEKMATLTERHNLLERDWEYCCGTRSHHRDHETPPHPHHRVTDPAGG